MTDALAVGLALAGLFFHAVGAVGVLRFPDFYTRAHALGVADVAGAVLMCAALVVHGGLTLASGKLILLILFIYAANPAATHAVMRAAHRNGLRPWTKP